MDRSRMYKNKDKSVEELRRRRVDQSVELRRMKKDEQLQKRRNVLLDEVDETSPLKERQLDTPEHLNYDSIIRDMQSEDDNVRFRAVQLCRKTLSRAKKPPIDEFYQRNAVQILVNTLPSSSDSLTFEATWALTNIASGESMYTTAVVESGAVPKLISLLNHSALNVAEQSVWALGNIAGDGSKFRDLLIGAGVLSPILKLLDRAWDMQAVVSNIAWVLSNLCRYRDPPPPTDVIKAMLPTLKRLLQYEKCQEVVVDTAWSLAYASDAINNIIDDIIASGCVEQLVRLLGSKTPNLISPALRALGNLVVGNDEQTQAVIDLGVLAFIPALLNNDKSNIVKETCWLTSNITAGNVNQIQSVIDHNILPCILEILRKSEFRVQKEACWVVSNISNGGSPEQCAYLMNQRVIPGLCNLLTVSEARVIMLVLEAIRKLFEVSEQFGHLEPACIELETCGGLDELEKLQDHENEQVYNLAYQLVERYFNDEVNDTSKGDESTNPAVEGESSRNPNPQNSDEFHFVAPESQPGQTQNFEF